MNLPDYYAILGVQTDADEDTLRKAYRQSALRCHPDRGGSHEKMLQLNEAWEILSNPNTRRHYDQARQKTASYQTRATAQHEAKQAQEQAGDYPRNWEEFESTFDAFCRDVKKAQYGNSGWTFGFPFPTVTGSGTGAISLILGGLLGCWAAAYYLWGPPGASSRKFSGAWRAALACVAIGAWLGVAFHALLRKLLPAPRKTATSENPGPTRSRHSESPEAATSEAIAKCELCGRQFTTISSVENNAALCAKCLARSQRSPGDAGAKRQEAAGTTPKGTEVLCCPECGQKLRVPRDRTDLYIRCPTCRFRWEGQTAQERPRATDTKGAYAETLLVNCPMCTRRLRLATAAKGRPVRCPKCKHRWIPFEEYQPGRSDATRPSDNAERQASRRPKENPEVPPVGTTDTPLMVKLVRVYALVASPILWVISNALCCIGGYSAENPSAEIALDIVTAFLALVIKSVLWWGGWCLYKKQSHSRGYLLAGMWGLLGIDLLYMFASIGIVVINANANTPDPTPAEAILVLLQIALGMSEFVFVTIAAVWLSFSLKGKSLLYSQE